MKNPKSNYIGEARRIKRNRMIIRGIVAGVVLLIVGFAIFFRYILSLKKDIDSEFTGTSATTVRPSSESTEPTSDVTDPSETPASNTETLPPSDPSTDTDPGTTTETQDPEATTAPEGSEGSEGTGEDTTTTTTVNLLPDDWSDRPSVLLPTKYPLQTVTHSERDQSYTSLKHAVKQYIQEHENARIGFYYINLNTKEAFGYNESQPFVVGSSIYLPLTMMLYDDVRAGTRSLDVALAFQKSNLSSETSSKMKEVPDGKQFFLYQLAYLALCDGDSAAMNMVLGQMGDSEELMERLARMCSCIDYTSVQNYSDYSGKQQSGDHRSSAYDLATFAEDLYWRYMSYPDDYQDLIDALGNADRTTGIGSGIPSDVLFLHRSGTNTDFHSESDVGIMLGAEPVVVCVTVEAATPAEAKEIQAALGALVYNFISYCHA